MATRSSGIAGIVTATAAGIALLYFLQDILIPLVLAIVLAVLVDALVRFIGARSRGAPHWAVVTLVAVIVIACAVAVALIVGQGLAQIVGKAPDLVVRLEQIVRELGRAVGLARTLHFTALLGEINLPRLAGSVAGGFGELLSGILLTITYFAFLVGGQQRFEQRLSSVNRSIGGAAPAKDAIDRAAANIEIYVWVQTVTGVMIAAPAALVMFGVGLENALFWTIVLFLLSYIPMIGVTVGSILPALFALLQFPSWWQAAVVFGGIQIAAFVVGNFVYPRMQAESQNIDPVATLLSLAFWGWLWGITGAFLAVPLTLMVMMICAGFPRTRWLAILLSNDGDPDFSMKRRTDGNDGGGKRE
ncbi:AI-2E family transporter [Sphingomonas sp. LaA6.9]|uniref:AI-2E family transporter n=1 Tax=Sphingomonas sp. LaA6.9 TaxID=2919914 RepID=UPI001F4F9056|nr:AI-2E family transporter [Sphingomonas sp. LaA6.9]MCJ8159633.1 AI-2E family transporter [Sphingomonas sp. LaA6.9]